jgi:hypothetical protein
VLWSTGCLGTFCQFPRGAHFFHDGLRNLVVAPRVDIEYRLQQRHALLTRGLRIALESVSGGGNRGVDVGGRAQADSPVDLLGCRVDDIESARLDGVYPAAVDIKL